MLSHDTRAESRERSLAALARAGIKPRVVLSHYAGDRPDAEVRARAYDALTVAHPNGLVFLEDDIDVRPDLFQRHVAMAVAAGKVTAFCAVNKRHYPPGALDAEYLKAALAPIPNYNADRGFHGSMAVYVPPAVVAFALSRPWEFQENPGGIPLTAPVIEPDHARGKVTGFDFWLKHTAAAFGGMYVALPNSVNHVSRHGTWPSLTYHTPEANPELAHLEAVC